MQMAYVYGFADSAHASVMQERKIGIIANNLANVNTPGYKADRLIFNEAMTRELRTDHKQGPMRATGNPFDLAVGGKGFFQVRTPEGVRLTRNGSFSLTPGGQLVNGDGQPVLSDGGGPVNINPEGPSPVINGAGEIYQGGDLVAKVGVVELLDPKNLIKAGNSNFVGQDGNPPATKPAADFDLVQGTLEGSNVQVVTEMVHMVAAHRGFESYQRALQVMDTVNGKAASELGRVG